MSTKRAVISIVTKSQPVDITTSIKVGDVTAGADVAGLSTTTVMTISDVFHPTGTKEIEGTAKGMVTLHNESNTPQPLVVRTRLESPEKPGVWYRIQEGVTVPAGGSIEVEVVCDVSGAQGDLPPQEKMIIPGLNGARQQEVYATASEPIEGGVQSVGVVSLDDVKEAEKILLERLEKEGTELLEAQYSDKKGVYSVIQHTFESDTQVGEEVAEFTLTGQATVMGVFYDQEGLGEYAMNALKKRELSDAEIIQPVEKAPTVQFDQYDQGSDVIRAKVFHSGIASLNPESPAIDKSMFLGKTRAEVRRYLLGLDYVYEVDVDFSPAWMQKVPFMAEHVTVVVKNVE
ncbi:hypothetical protein H6758_03175 [Candidatus Nomurabacteria bacterium]|nr:hypothetical protein [Candidatus Nomurabacteria bacterium]